MPDRTVPVLAAYLWDLRSQCEAQVRALTNAQRQIDVVRDGQDRRAILSAIAELQQDLQRVVRANAEIRAAVREALEQADRLGAMYGVDRGK